MSLSTGRRLNRHNWTSLHMPQEVIEREHILARHSYANRGLTLAWRDGAAIPNSLNNVDDDSDDKYMNDDEGHDNDDDDDDDDQYSNGESIPRELGNGSKETATNSFWTIFQIGWTLVFLPVLSLWTM